MSIDFSRRKGRSTRDASNSSPGRLCVGWRIADWTKIYYEPIIKDNEGDAIDPNDDEEPEMGLYCHGSGCPQKREPLDSEIFWHAHFDLANQPSKAKKHKGVLQKRFLYDAWRYCAETDLARIEEMEITFHRPLSRHWQSWFDMAEKWKKTDSKRRAANRKKKMDIVRQSDIDPKDVDINSDDSDDSGFEDDDDMPGAFAGPMGPPPRPSRDGAGSKRKGSTAASSREGPATKYLRANPMMTGAGRRARNSRAGSTFSDGSKSVLRRLPKSRIIDSDNEDDAPSVMSNVWEDQHPSLPLRDGTRPLSRSSRHSSRVIHSPGRANSADNDDNEGDDLADTTAAPRSGPRISSGEGGAAADLPLTPPSTSAYNQRTTSRRTTKSPTQRRISSRHASVHRESEDPSGELKPFHQWAPDNRANNTIFGSSLFTSQEPDNGADADAVVEERDENITLAGNGTFPSNQELFAAINGEGVSDADAMRLATRMSIAPEERLGSHRARSEPGVEQKDVMQSIEVGVEGTEVVDDGYVEGREE
ncbi:hypothetical protein LTR78_008778 [Recurvomyces mirabilis]|uniref:Uncharacterized protein n=1 Tax=Recurvomyces mirabilis TaxID=574656 RepID=A0AAE0TQE0_9PEZI|nr:hypothetical protein LTR78_008778 [Recurvomyces mirabilis]KAK5160984.1 hypothetical protein LTS14_000778 [Recurvomyces mirabilis]